MKMAQEGGKLWKKYGALDYKECIGDDLSPSMGGIRMTKFSKMARTKPGETVVFSYIVYKSRKHRDQVNAKVMKDPRLAEMMDPKAMPFDGKRLIYGGFESLVKA